MQIRPARIADIPAIFHVRTSVRENHLSLAELAGLGITPDTLGAMIDAQSCAWVAEEAGRIAGFSMIDPEEATLFAVFVLPEAEGRGLGRALLAPAEAALFALHDRIWLETAAESRAAGFYRRQGWGEAEEVGEGDIRLWKRRPTPVAPAD